MVVVLPAADGNSSVLTPNSLVIFSTDEKQTQQSAGHSGMRTNILDLNRPYLRGIKQFWLVFEFG